MLKFLLSQFVKRTGRTPNAIEMLQLKFKASQQVGKGEVVPFPRERITDWTKARPQPPEIEIIDGVQTTRGLGDLFERQMKNIGKKDPALYEDRGGNIIPTQFSEAPAFPSYTAKETDAQILKRLKKQNKDSINRLKNKKDPEDPQKFYQGGQAQIEPDLSGIGHGSDALMARNMLIAPGSQATTSTGLNYLLGEDNDTTRVPYKDGFSVQPFVSASKSNQGFEDGTNVDLQDLTYGGNVMYDKGPFSVGIEHLKGKDKYNFKYKDDTIVKDTSDRENTNLLFAIDIANTIKGKARLNKKGGQFEISMPFAEGGRTGYKEAGPVVLPKPKPKPNADPLIELQRIYDLYQESMPGVSQETQKYLQQDFIQKLNDAGISQEQFMTNQMQNNFANGGRINFRGGGMDMGNESNQKKSASMGSTKSSTNKGPAGGASSGGNYGGNRNPNQTYGGGNTPPSGPPGGGDPKMTYNAQSVTTGGQSPFGYTAPNSYNYGINKFAPSIMEKFKANKINSNKTYSDPFDNPNLTYNETTGQFEDSYGNIVNSNTLGATQAKTFNTMKELMTIPGATSENVFGKKHSLTSEGKNLGKFMKSANNLATKNPNVSSSLDSVQNWMTGGNQANTYKDYMDPDNPTQFNSTIQNAIDRGLYSNESDFTNQTDILELAEGGPARQNFKMGKRAFLKLIGGVGAGIAGIKTGLLGLGKKTVAKSVIAPAAHAANEAGIPPYFFKLVNKIKSLGDDATPKYANQPRETVTRYKDYELTEHLDTGQTTVRRFKQSEADYYDEPLMEEVYMSHRPGEMTEGAGGKFIKTADEYVEDTSFLRTGGGNKGEVMDTVDGLPDDLLEELGETIVKKADGGRIGYKLGKKVIQEGIPGLIKKVNKLFGKEVVTTADKLPIPKKTLDRDMFNAANKRLNKKRQLTDTEIQDYEMELGDSETWMSEGTLGEAENALKNQKAYQDDMYQQYKMGKLDPVAGDKSPARKRFLEQKLADMEASGDKRLMTRDEIEELSTFDLGTQMDQMKEVEINKIKTLPKIDDKLLKNYIKEIKAGVEDVMRDTSPAGLEKSIEIDNLMLKYPGLSRDFADQIASSSPTMKADMIAMVKQTFKMSEQGMSGDDIIQTFKNTPRTKQATGGLASILGE
jgi:hypothetical protein